MLRSRTSEFAWYAVAAIVVATFVAFALAKGVPAMRHDWWMSPTTPALRAEAYSSLSTWRNDGLGNPSLYPNDYLFYIAVLLFTLVLPPAGTLAAVLLVVAALALAAARSFSPERRIDGVGVALLAILLFNPWTYTELVAGHLPMLVSFAGCAWFAAEALRGREASPIALSVATIAIAQQLQFLAIFVPASIAFALGFRRWQPLAIALVLALPVFIGIALGLHDLNGIPYTLDWEKNQSLHAPAAFTLRGYFAQYDAALGHAGAAGGALLASLAIVAVVLERSRVAFGIALALLVIFLWTLGANGPIAPFHAFVVTHVRASALFRELYDLLAYAAIGYVALIALAAVRSGWVACGAIAAAALAIAGWSVGPPANFWVASAQIPMSDVTAAENTRFALVPAFQPLQFLREGSGTDPDVFNRPGNVVPLNAYLPAYPAVTALARYVANGDDSMLRGLSVTQVLTRPWLCTDVASLHAQVASTMTNRVACPPETPPRRIDGIAELTLGSAPGRVTLSTPGDGNVLFMDAYKAWGVELGKDIVVPVATASGTDPQEGWLDARLFFATHPLLGQPYGGVYTESAEPLPVLPFHTFLAQIDGRLFDADSSALLSLGTGGEYRWIATRGVVKNVRCQGACAIAAEVPFDRAGLPLTQPPVPSRPIAFDAPLPWLVHATLPAVEATSLLRYNVAYSPYWAAVSNGPLVHVRIDGAVNGFAAAKSFAGGEVWLIEIRSAACALAEVLAIIGVALILLVPRFRSWTPALRDYKHENRAR